MNDSILSIRDFKEIIGYEREGTYIRLFVSAMVDYETVYEEYTDCIISYQAGYADYVVKIDWNVSNTVMRALGLHAQYSTNFCEMECDGCSLIVRFENGEITLSKGK